MSEQYCQAKTWSQAQSGSWAGSHPANGCQRKAVDQVEDDQGNLVWACRHHINKAPGFGWNR